MIKYAMIKAILSALAVTTPVAETTYLDTGIYCSDTQSVVDSEGEEWGYDVELPDGTPVIITFDSKNTDSRYDDVITGLTEMDADDITNMIDVLINSEWKIRTGLEVYFQDKEKDYLFGTVYFNIHVTNDVELKEIIVDAIRSRLFQ